MKTKTTRVVTHYEHRCLRCGSRWRSSLERPVRCGKCKSPYWDKERKNGNA